MRGGTESQRAKHLLCVCVCERERERERERGCWCVSLPIPRPFSMAWSVFAAQTAKSAD